MASLDHDPARRCERAEARFAVSVAWVVPLGLALAFRFRPFSTGVVVYALAILVALGLVGAGLSYTVRRGASLDRWIEWLEGPEAWRRTARVVLAAALGVCAIIPGPRLTLVASAVATLAAAGFFLWALQRRAAPATAHTRAALALGSSVFITASGFGPEIVRHLGLAFALCGGAVWAARTRAPRNPAPSRPAAGAGRRALAGSPMAATLLVAVGVLVFTARDWYDRWLFRDDPTYHGYIGDPIEGFARRIPPVPPGVTPPPVAYLLVNGIMTSRAAWQDTAFPAFLAGLETRYPGASRLACRDEVCELPLSRDLAAYYHTVTNAPLADAVLPDCAAYLLNGPAAWRVGPIDGFCPVLGDVLTARAALLGPTYNSRGIARRVHLLRARGYRVVVVAHSRGTAESARALLTLAAGTGGPAVAGCVAVVNMAPVTNNDGLAPWRSRGRVWDGYLDGPPRDVLRWALPRRWVWWIARYDFTQVGRASDLRWDRAALGGPPDDPADVHAVTNYLAHPRVRAAIAGMADALRAPRGCSSVSMPGAR